jgi:hypothetical protein
VGVRLPRLEPSLWDVADLLMVSPVWLRAAIGLAFGAGMRESEVRWLRRGHIHRASRRICLLANLPGLPKDSARLRCTWAPPWVMDLLDELRGPLRRLHPSGLLFPSPLDLRRPRTSLNPGLRRACEDAWGEDGPTFTLGDLRRSWQALCRAHELPRAIVRQTWWTLSPPPGRLLHVPPEALALQRLTGRWKELGDPVADTLRSPRPVPRAATKGTGPWEPEPGPRPGAWTPVPGSCLFEGSREDEGTFHPRDTPAETEQ